MTSEIERGTPYRQGVTWGRQDRDRWRVPKFNVSNLVVNNSPFWQEFMEGYVEGYFC